MDSHDSNPTMNRLESDIMDAEEIGDVIGPLPPMFRRRIKAMSDVAGFNINSIVAVEPGAKEHQRPHRVDRRAKSDITIMLNLGPELVQESRRRREKSSSDVVTTFADLPELSGYDLRLAEQVSAYGTASERREMGMTDDDSSVLIEENVAGQLSTDFHLNHDGLTTEQANILLDKHGRNELPEKHVPQWLVFLQLLFWAPMPLMIWLAIIVEAAIQNFLDMGILLFIQITNASISFYETNKAGNAVAALKSSLKPSATCKRDGKWITLDSAVLVPGDTVLLGSGSAVPADCRLNASEIEVDQAALTGESLPVTFYKYDSVKMGSTVVRGEVEATVEFTGADTFFGKTASLLEDTNELSHLQKIIMTIMYLLVGLSVTLSGIYFIYLLANGVDIKEALSFTVVILVASIPLAIEIVVTTTLAIGSKKLAHHGAIVVKLSAIEDLAGMSILCSDKTGTLTLNQMMLQDEAPIYEEGLTREHLLMYAAMAAKWKEPPRDALDRLTLGNVNMELLEPFDQIDYMPFDPQVKRTEGTVRDTRTQESYKTSKGAPHIILNLLRDDNLAVNNQVEADVARLGERGIRSLAVARTDPKTGEWKMAGLLTFLDPPRPDTKQTIADAVHHGVDVKMITGDHYLIAQNTALVLEMGDRIFTAERLPLLDPETKQKPADLSKNYGDLCLVANGFAQVFPEHKYLIIECLREMHYTVGMTGDGVNDAPALKRADVGIAVAGATDAARAAADIVLTEEGLGTIIHGIIIAREIFQRISNFITYRIAATLQLLVFFFISIFAFKPVDYDQPDNLQEGDEWPEFFHMPVIMLMLITLLNDGTLISIAYDYAKASDSPDRWNLAGLILTSSVLGAVSCFSSLLLLYFLLDSWNPNGFFQSVGMVGVQYGQVTTAIYLKVSVSDFLTLFSARTGRNYFFQVKPAPMLLIGAAIALLLSSILSLVWPDSSIDDIPVKGLISDIGIFFFVWILCIVFFFLQDFLKVMLYRWMFATNFNNISTTGVVVLPESAKKFITDLEDALQSK